MGMFDKIEKHLEGRKWATEPTPAEGSPEQTFQLALARFSRMDSDELANVGRELSRLSSVQQSPNHRALRAGSPQQGLEPLIAAYMQVMDSRRPQGR